MRRMCQTAAPCAGPAAAPPRRLASFGTVLLLLLAGCAQATLAPRTASLPSPIPASQAPGTIWAGAARVEITPPVGTPLAGYSRRRGRPSQGVHDPVYARALALSDGRHLIVLVSAEVLIIDGALYDAVLRRIAERYPVGREGLFLWATHTHSGSGAYGRRFLERLSMGRYDQRVFDALARRIAEAAAHAIETLAPASVRGGSVTVEGAARNRVSEGGPTDPTVRLLRIADGSDRPVVWLVTFAAHPTVLPAANRACSGDYPGALMRAVEAQQPDSVCLFAAGAIGDQAPVYGAGDRFIQMERLGGRLAAAALGAATGPPVAQGWIDTVTEPLALPPARLRLGRLRLPAWMSRGFVAARAPLHLAAVDRWLFIGAPCDLGLEVGVAIGAAARERGWEPLLIGFAEDYMGYVLPAAAYASDTYEARMHFYGPGLADLLTRTLARMMDHLTLAEAHAATR